MHASIFRIHLEIYETFIHEHLAPLALKKTGKLQRSCKPIYKEERCNRFLRFLTSLIKNGGTLRKMLFTFL